MGSLWLSKHPGPASPSTPPLLLFHSLSVHRATSWNRNLKCFVSLPLVLTQILWVVLATNKIIQRLKTMPSQSFLGAQVQRICLPMQKTQETWVWSLGQEDPLKEEMATHSSILSWKVPWTEEPGGLQSMESQRVGHAWVTEHTCISVRFSSN